MPDTPFAIQAGALRQALAFTPRIISRRNTIPILSHVLLRAEAGVLTMRATDLEVHFSTTAEGSGDLPAVTVAPGPLLTMLSILPPEETVELSIAKAGQLELSAGATRARLFTMPPEDMPELKEWTPTASWTIQAGALRALLRRPFHAISTEETRYYLRGIYLHPAEAEGQRQLRAVATDGHRMMVAHTDMPEGLEGTMPAQIIPRATLTHLLTLLPRLPDNHPLTVRQSDTRIEITSGRAWTLRSKVIDGTFPDYGRVIPKGDGTPVEVKDSAALSRAITLATALSLERSRPITFSNGDGNRLRLTGRSAEEGEVSTTVPAETAAWASNRPHHTFSVQARYMQDVCATFRTGFRMRVQDGSSPIRVEGAEGLAVLMPMRV